ncbi:hypothetical protein OPU71_18985 [Niveibacterium sp. 24ML]|uniref:hypothetical protein n=1 Tax=Niveibacterium sp. 24ML TaxID=2985512 RepID=UPI00226E28C5|nr:hypothetical protein [Niveibacterium sp. 24ML]MCX9158214.1 hypothetical protein [Niveibacterium sp. 24ML]
MRPYLLALTILLGMLSTAQAQERGSRVWIERAWEFRYILKIGEPSWFAVSAKQGKDELAKGDPLGYYEPESIMPDVKTFEIPNEYNEYDNKVSTLLMSFSEQGEVISPYDWPHKLFGRINRIRGVVLAPGNGPNDLQFDVGEWFTGHTADDTLYIPAICSGDDERRYTKGYQAEAYDRVGNFGCREWAYYLMSADYPYIDVTSYTWGEDDTKKRNKAGKYPLRREAYIRPVIGWGRFDVPPKPVIGRHGTNWVCLHECPNGDAPGIIPDIKAWAAKNGWPVPKAPKKMPLFPNKQYKPGELVD